MSFADIAADGTDPARLERVVARMLAPRGQPESLARACRVQAADRDLPEEGLDVDQRQAVLEAVAPAPTTTACEAAAVVARQWSRLEVRAAVLGDPTYPRTLAWRWPSNDAPLLLAWRGPDDLNAARTAAIVGARRASPYGTGVAAWIAAGASDAGIRIVSGGAVGIDGAAHEAAMDGRGGTAVMLGCGHSVDYPREHAAPGGLFDRVLDTGGALVSELPPGARPHASNVLARNRLVAGLARAVVVVEGGPTSGSLNTASIAADLGIPVLAVPGDVRAPGSAAPHRLLTEGAAPCTEPQDLIEMVRGTVDPASGSRGGTDDTDEDSGSVATSLPPDVYDVLARRWPRPVRVDELAETCGIATARLLARLTRARIAGEIAESAEGIRLRSEP